MHQLITRPSSQDAAIVATINPEKPRKGCLYAKGVETKSTALSPARPNSLSAAYAAHTLPLNRSTMLGSEVRVGDKAVVSLLDLPRPFLKLKALEMEDVAKAVIKEMKA